MNPDLRRVGAVDVGSNAIRLVIAELSPPDRWSVLVEERAPVRLGRRADGLGKLPPDARTEAVRSLRSFADQLERARPAAIRCVATSAVREAADGADFLREVAAETGLRVEAIDGAEEARLVRLAVASRLPVDVGSWLLVDLGGGSLEVTILQEGSPVVVDSRPLGAVRLLGELEVGGTERVRAHVDTFLGELDLPGVLRGASTEVAATGGNIESLCDLVGGRQDQGAKLPLLALERSIVRLGSLSVEGRIDLLGLRPDRADVILPAAIAYAMIARRVGAEVIHVPRVGLKEGLLIDLARGLLQTGG